GVVDVAVDVVGTIGLRMQAAADGVGSTTKHREIAAFEEGDAFVEGEALAVRGLVQNTLYSRSHFNHSRQQHHCGRSNAGALPASPIQVPRPTCNSGASRPAPLLH